MKVTSKDIATVEELIGVLHDEGHGVSSKVLGDAYDLVKKMREAKKKK